MFEKNTIKEPTKYLKKNFPHAYLSTYPFFLDVGTRPFTVLCSKALFKKFEAARKNMNLVKN